MCIEPPVPPSNRRSLPSTAGAVAASGWRLDVRSAAWKVNVRPARRCRQWTRSHPRLVSPFGALCFGTGRSRVSTSVFRRRFTSIRVCPARLETHVAACLEMYLTVAHRHLHVMTTPDGNAWEQFDDRRADAFLEGLDQPAEDTWEMQWHGADSPDEASEFQFEVFAEDQVKARLSFLRFALPLGNLPESKGTFAALVRRSLPVAAPDQGYAGIGFLESPDPGVKTLAEPMVYALAQRFPGIEVDRPLIHLLYLSDGIKGVNWLTALGLRWVEAMGGAPVLRATLPKAFVFHPFDGGLLIQAGPAPQAGERNQKIWPVLYPDLARLLKPIRIKEHGCFDYYGPDRFTEETTMEWLNRFDRDPW